jgi:hypothetical protein
LTGKEAAIAAGTAIRVKPRAIVTIVERVMKPAGRFVEGS